ncbi:MAG: pyridoxine 5'-phosphate synthase [Gemmataceae bacterium]
MKMSRLKLNHRDQPAFALGGNCREGNKVRQLGATAVELQTASYSEAKTPTAVEAELKKLQKTSRLARGLGLHVHMGHGLNYHNVQAISAIPEVEELNIGHSIVSRAVLVGMERAVRDMKQAMAEGAARRRDS